MTPPSPRGTPSEVFRAFLLLGLTSFGGPIAHLGFFRDAFVLRRRWLSEEDWADLVALCQFLPGPASSQAGFALGLMRAGPLGALAAFLGFTLPSVLLMIAAAWGALALGTGAAGVIAGLKIAATAVVAQAVLGMARSLCPDGPRASLAVLALILLALVPGPFAQIAAIAAGAAAGLLFLTPDPARARGLAIPVSRAAAIAAGLAALALLLLLPLTAGLGPLWTLADGTYRAGALVFGGGHVVLPLLDAAVVTPGLVAPETFLAGYAAAQAVPGPLFTVASFLGTAALGLPGALVATAAIFLPGFLLLIAALPFWSSLARAPRARAAMAGANAAVVGLLAAALHDPLVTSAITGPAHLALAAACLTALLAWRAPPWTAVLIGAAGGLLLP